MTDSSVPPWGRHAEAGQGGNGNVAQAIAQVMAQRLASGDEAQIRLVVTKYEPMLRRVARRHVGAAHVDDVVQEAWVAALRGIHRFEGRGAFEGWLVSITANIAKTWGVRESRSTPVEKLP